MTTPMLTLTTVADGGLKPVPGIELAAGGAGIKCTDRDDLVLFKLAPDTRCAGVFTRNAFAAAPVCIAKSHIESAPIKALLVNSGNANAATGEEGLTDATLLCAAVAAELCCDARQVLPFSTGVIGARLPVRKMADAIPGLCRSFSAENWGRAARAIMTTDTRPKGCSTIVEVAGVPITITGIGKGAGMIRPDMATMLAFLATDAAIARPALQAMLARAVEQSFNRITVDGDTSTNDAAVLMATGTSAAAEIRGFDDPRFSLLSSGITEVCRYLAMEIVRDGEGATKFISVIVEQGSTARECLEVAYAIAHSPLVKTACFASDPNWGRIVAAVGRAGIPDLDAVHVAIYLDDVCVVENGAVCGRYQEEAGRRIMRDREFSIRVKLGRGVASEQVWTCDLSQDYVRINAEYRS